MMGFLMRMCLLQLLLTAITPETFCKEGRQRRQVYREDLSPLLGGRVPSGALDYFRLMFNSLDSRGISIPDGFILSNDRLPPPGVRSDERRIRLYSDDGDDVASSYTVRNPVPTRHVIVPRAPPQLLVGHQVEEPEPGYVHDIGSIQAYFENPSDEYHRNLANLPGFIRNYQSSYQELPPGTQQGPSPSSSEAELSYNQEQRPYHPQHHHLYYPQPPVPYQPSPPDYTAYVQHSQHNFPQHSNNGLNGSDHYGHEPGCKLHQEHQYPDTGFAEREPTTESPSPSPAVPAESDEYETNFPTTLQQEIENEKFHAQIPQKAATEDQEKEEPEEETDLPHSNTTPLPQPQHLDPVTESAFENTVSNNKAYPVSTTNVRQTEFHVTEPILKPAPVDATDINGYTKFKNLLIDEIMTRLKQSAFDGTTHHIVTILPPTKLLTQPRASTKKREAHGRNGRSNTMHHKDRKRKSLNLMLSSLVKALTEK